MFELDEKSNPNIEVATHPMRPNFASLQRQGIALKTNLAISRARRYTSSIYSFSPPV